MVENHILMADIPRWQAIMLNKQWYDPVALYRWIRQRPTVPHSQRNLGASEIGKIVRRAADVAARRGDPSAQNLATAAERYALGKRPRRTPVYKRPPRYTQGRSVYFRRRQSGVTEEGNTIGQGGWVFFKVNSAVHASRWNPATRVWAPLELDRHDKTILLLRPSKVEWSFNFDTRTGEGSGWQPFVYGRISEWHRPDTRSALRIHRSDDWQKAMRAQFPGMSNLWDGLSQVDPFNSTIR